MIYTWYIMYLWIVQEPHTHTIRYFYYLYENICSFFWLSFFDWLTAKLVSLCLSCFFLSFPFFVMSFASFGFFSLYLYFWFLSSRSWLWRDGWMGQPKKLPSEYKQMNVIICNMEIDDFYERNGFSLCFNVNETCVAHSSIGKSVLHRLRTHNNKYIEYWNYIDE